MPISSDRIVKRFFVGGIQDAQAGTEGPSAGYATFDAAVSAAAQWQLDHSDQNVTTYVFEAYRIAPVS